MVNGVFCIEKKSFQVFLHEYKNRRFAGQRLGQAFYNHFKLDKISSQNALLNLYQKDGEEALNLIKKIFSFS